MKRTLAVLAALGLVVAGATASQALVQKVSYPGGAKVSLVDGTCSAIGYSTDYEDLVGATYIKSGQCDYVRVRIHYSLNSWNGYSNWTTVPDWAVRYAPGGSTFNQSQHGADRWH